MKAERIVAVLLLSGVCLAQSNPAAKQPVSTLAEIAAHERLLAASVLALQSQLFVLRSQLEFQDIPASKVATGSGWACPDGRIMLSDNRDGRHCILLRRQDPESMVGETALIADTSR